MKNIADIDKNFVVETKIEKEDIVFRNVLEEPFSIHGLFYEDGKFRRIPEEVAKEVNEGVHFGHAHTAGGRVRFRTDSPYVGIYVKMSRVARMAHFALSGSSGFDLYQKKDGKDVYWRSFVPPFDMEDGYESVVEFATGEMREITIHFPLYSEVCELYIGLAETARLEPPNPYRHQKPIVYYGSSITQGGCASRPGNAYQGPISRRFDADFINLGFSGSAKGEVAIAEYIKNLDMSLFVYDYDHNAPTPEFLKETHERMFRIIRDANPDLPIIMMSRPEEEGIEAGEKRRAIISETYENARFRGDDKVWFVSGLDLMAGTENDGSVDACHPNDFGFASMARVLGDKIEEVLFPKNH